MTRDQSFDNVYKSEIEKILQHSEKQPRLSESHAPGSGFCPGEAMPPRMVIKFRQMPHELERICLFTYHVQIRVCHKLHVALKIHRIYNAKL